MSEWIIQTHSDTNTDDVEYLRKMCVDCEDIITTNGIVHTDYEYSRIFVEMFAKELKELGIKYVINHGELKEIPRNAVLIYCYIDGIRTDIYEHRIEDEFDIDKILRIFNEGHPCTTDMRTKHGYCTEYMCYDPKRNTFVISDITHNKVPSLWLFAVNAMKMLKLKVLGADITKRFELRRLSFEYLNELRYLPLYITSIPPIDLSPKELNIEEIRTEEDRLIITFSIEKEIETNVIANHRRGCLVAVPPIKVVVKTITLVFNISEKHYSLVEVKGDAFLLYKDKEYYHPNISDDGIVCLGSAEREILKSYDRLTTDVLRSIIDKIVKILSIPSTSAYTPEIFNDLYDDGVSIDKCIDF